MAFQERAGRRPLTWLWMALALVCVAGFLTWLGLASEPSSVAIVEEDDQDEEELAGGGDFLVVPKDTVAAYKQRYEGQRIRIPSVEATGNLGPQVFWGELGTTANQVPILVRMDSSLVSGGMTVDAGRSYRITGLMQRMSDSIAVAWQEEGVLPNEDAVMQATFADYYIEASDIRPARREAGDDNGRRSGGGARDDESAG